jgi:hypothetical protein
LCTPYLAHTLSDKRPNQRRWRLLSRARAREVALEVHGGEEGLSSYISQTKQRTTYVWLSGMPRDLILTLTTTELTTSLRLTTIRRFLATTRLPYLNPKSRSTETGLSCKGCQAALERRFRVGASQNLNIHVLLDMRDRTFTKDMFLDHFAICTDAQRMWAEFQGTNGRV